MEDDQRTLYFNLGSKKPQLQVQALKSIQALVNRQIGVSLLLPRVAEVALEESGRLQAEAIEVLSGAIASPAQRELCSCLDDLVSSVLSLFASANSKTASALCRGLAALAPQDFTRYLATFQRDPETLIRRALEHKDPSVAGIVVTCLGQALVRAWPCVAAGHDEPLRDACQEALRIILACLASDGAAPPTKMAAASVLDALIAGYLNTEPTPFAPLALMHVGWSFMTIYSTLLVELMRDLRPALEFLSGQQPAVQTLVTKSCIWIPSATAGAADVTSSDWNAISPEIVAFRASLAWVVIHGGGLAQQQEDGSDGALIPSVLLEASRRGRRGTPAAAPSAPQRLQFPDPLRSALARAAEQGSGSWRTKFCQCRAQVMLAVVDMAIGLHAGNGSLADTSPLLRAAEAAVGIARAGGPESSVLRAFATECASSLLALWALLGQPTSTAAEQAKRACKVGAECLVLAGQPGPEPSSMSPTSATRQLRYAALAAKVLVQTALQQPEPLQLRPVLSGAAASEATVPTAALALLCCECSAQLLQQDSRRGPHAEASLQRVIAELVQLFCTSVFFQMQQLSSGGRKDAAAMAEAAVACLTGLVCLSRGRLGGSALGQPVQRLAEILGRPDTPKHIAVSAMLVAVLPDAPRMAKENAFEPVRQLAAQGGPEIQEYADTLVRAGSGGQGQAIAAPMSNPDVGGAVGLWLQRFAEAVLDSAGNRPVSVVSPSTPVSGPPLMVSVRPSASWPKPGEAHVVLRIDIFNTTGLSYRNLMVGFSVCRHGRHSETDRQAWKFSPGLARPSDQTIETLVCRGSATLWRDIFVTGFEPLSVGLTFSYDNVAPDSAGPASGIGIGMGGPGGSGGGGSGGGAGGGAGAPGSADVWSSDEEDNFRLHFSCQPCPLSLSVFFVPFRGFDTPICTVHPPPMVFSVCRHSRIEDVSEHNMDFESWRPQGFHAIIGSSSSRTIAPDVQVCLAGLFFDGESVVCFLGRIALNGSQKLEVRSTSERLLNDLMQDLAFWISTATMAH